jgi:hypothetical protein
MDPDAENRVRQALPQLYEMLFSLTELKTKPIHDREDVAQETILNVLREEFLLRECHQMLKGHTFIAIPFRVKQLMFRLWHRQAKKSPRTIDLTSLEGSIGRENVGRNVDLWLDSRECVNGVVDEQLMDMLKGGYSKQELCSRLGLSSRFLAKWLEQKRTELRLYSHSTH